MPELIRIQSADKIKDHKGRFVIASIHKKTNEVSIVANPVSHLSKQEAFDEAGRLAAAHTDKKFLVMPIIGIASANGVVFE